MDNIILKLQDVLNKLRRETIIVGDFNCRVDVRIKDDRGEILVEFLTESGFIMLNDPNKPTYISHNGYSTIDLVFCNFQINTSALRINNNPLRKHRILTLEVSINERVTTNNYTNKMKLDIRINEDILRHHPNINILNNKSLTIDEYNNKLTEMIQESATCKKKIRHHRIWFDDECRQAKKAAIEAERNLPVEKNLLIINEYKRNYKETIKRKKQQYHDKVLLEKIEESTKSPWILFRKYKPYKNNVTMFQWRKHFSSLLNNNSNINHPCCTDTLSEKWYNKPITEEELEKGNYKASK